MATKKKTDPCGACKREMTVDPGREACTHACMCSKDLIREYAEKEGTVTNKVTACPICYERFSSVVVPSSNPMPQRQKRPAARAVDATKEGKPTVNDAGIVTVPSPRIR